MTWGEALLYLWKERGMTQRRIAEAVGVGTCAVNNWANSVHTPLPIFQERLIALARKEQRVILKSKSDT